MCDEDYPTDAKELERRNPFLGVSESIGGVREAGTLQIVSGCRRGDRCAQRQLYEAFHRQIYRLMVRIVDAEVAADLTQQAFLQAYRKIGQYAGRGPLDRWLYRLAVNEAYQYLRRRRRVRETQLVYEPVDSSAGGVRILEQRELMEQAMSRLDPELRSAFLLREMDEFSYQEIAETLDIPEGTVGSRLNRARRELRDHLLDLGWEP